MKVFRRLLIKFIILVFVVVIFGGAAYLVHYYPQSVPESALEEYLTLLVAGDTEKAYEQLDQSENTQMTLAEYETAVQSKKYVQCDSYQLEEISSRQGTNGDSYVDYNVSFLDASGAVLMEGSFTVKKQSEEIFGLMPQWRVLASHCMVTNLRVTVPAGSTVYLDGEEAGASWIVDEDVSASKDCYEIPSLLAGTVDVVVRNAILESYEATLETADGDVDYSGQMALKESAESACEELAVEALKQIYQAAVVKGLDTENVDTDSESTEDQDNAVNDENSEENEELTALFAACLDEVLEIIENQSEEFYRENTVTHPEFESVGIYDYEAEFEAPVYTEEENGAITTVMTFTYRYIVRNTERVETGEIWADGTNAWEFQTVSYTGEASAEFSLSWYEEEWHIESVTLPVIPEAEGTGETEQ
ncbi:MAG: hypothetical protein LUD18_04190 [Lachnospiraceae bacterium]|nr:hypothetical protein [Lachnospiraceae bacterium]